MTLPDNEMSTIFAFIFVKTLLYDYSRQLREVYKKKKEKEINLRIKTKPIKITKINHAFLNV